MEVTFAQANLELLEIDANFTGGYGPNIVKAYRRCMQQIRASVDERDLRAFKSRRFEKLKGNRSHQRSLRLNDQRRLIVEIVKSSPKNAIVIVGIEDYH